MRNRGHLRISLIGQGEASERWAAALSSSAQVIRTPDQPMEPIDALVLTAGAGDLFSRAKEALQATVPVLYAAPFTLSPWQTDALRDLSERQRCLLRFQEPFRYRPGFAFLRRLLEGEEPFWRPLYLRSLRAGQADGQAHIADLATQELAACDALLDSTPALVVASANYGAEAAEMGAIFLTVHYSTGPMVQCTISLAEATAAGQLVAVTQHRTIILDDLDPTAPLRIIGGSANDAFIDGSGVMHAWQTGVGGSGANRLPDPVAEEAQQFLNAVATGDCSLANGESWVRVASLWWAARQSMSFGGPADVPTPFSRPVDTATPPFRVIQGGGKTVPAATQRPPLTVIAR